MATLICPVCSTELVEAGYTARCRTCGGAWATEAAVIGMLEERASTLVELPWEERVDKVRACADCKKPMQTVNLGSVALDRCESHGVWFDAHELVSLLEQAKQFKAKDHDEHDGHRVGLMARLAKLF